MYIVTCMGLSASARLLGFLWGQEMTLAAALFSGLHPVALFSPASGHGLGAFPC